MPSEVGLGPAALPQWKALHPTTCHQVNNFNPTQAQLTPCSVTTTDFRALPVPHSLVLYFSFKKKKKKNINMTYMHIWYISDYWDISYMYVCHVNIHLWYILVIWQLMMSGVHSSTVQDSVKIKGQGVAVSINRAISTFFFCFYYLSHPCIQSMKQKSSPFSTFLFLSPNVYDDVSWSCVFN